MNVKIRGVCPTERHRTGVQVGEVLLFNLMPLPPACTRIKQDRGRSVVQEALQYYHQIWSYLLTERKRLWEPLFHLIGLCFTVYGSCG